MTSGVAGRASTEKIIAAVMAGAGRSLATSVSLPRESYISEGFFEFETEAILRHDWTCIGHVSQVSKVGDYFTIDLLNEKLLVVRGRDRVRVLSNICLHRWAEVACGSGHADSFTCPFHNWAYGIDGRLLGAPFTNKVEDFDVKNCSLPEIRSEIAEELGLIFVTFSDVAPPIGPRLADLAQRLANYKMSELIAVDPYDRESPFNWKFAIETGMEAYHHFGTHRASLEPTYPTRKSWCEESKPAWTVCHSDAVEDRTDLTLPIFPGLSSDDWPGLDLYHIYPLTRLGVYPDRIRLQTIMPMSAARTRRRTLYLLRPEVAANLEEVRRIMHSTINSSVGGEDNAINIMQQSSVRSGHAQGGRLSPLEATVWHLAEYLRDKIAQIQAAA